MMLQLSDKDSSILLGATLMHWGVPFRSAARHELAEHQQAIIDEASDKLIDLHEKYQQHQVQETQEVPLADQEVVLLLAVVEDCLNEIGSDPTALSLQLKARDRNEVDTLLERIRASLGSRYAKLA